MDGNQTDNTVVTPIATDDNKKPTGVQILDTVNKTLDEVKNANNEVLTEVKSAVNAMTDVAKVLTENIKIKSNEIKQDNGEIKSSFGVDLNHSNPFLTEIKSASEAMLRNKAPQIDFLQDPTFNHYVDYMIEKKCHGSKADKEKWKEEIFEGFEIAKKNAGNEAPRIIPIFCEEIKADDGTYRESVGRDGGFVARPAEVDPVIQQNYNRPRLSMRELSTVVKIASMEYKEILEGMPEPAYWGGEEGKKKDDKSSHFELATIKTGELIRPSKITRKMLEDSGLDLVDLIRRNEDIEMRKAEEKAFLFGDEQNDRPLGLFNSKFGEISTDNFDTEINSYKYEVDKFLTYTIKDPTAQGGVEKLLDAIMAMIVIFQEEYVDNLSILINTNDWIKVLAYKDAVGRYMHSEIIKGLPNIATKFKRLFECNIYTSRLIPAMIKDDGTLNTNVKGIFVGDVSRTYKVVDRLEIVRWVNVITDINYIHYFSRKRVGGRPYNFSKGGFIKTANA